MQALPRTGRPWCVRLIDAVVAGWRERQRRSPVQHLDARALADIGVDGRDIRRITAEASQRARLVQLRIVAHGHHV